MGYLDYYKYQAMARGIRSVDDVIQDAQSKAHIYRQIVLPWLPPKKSLRIAELACGHGSLLYWLRNQGFACLTGVDSSAEQVALALQVGVPVHHEDVNVWLQRPRVDSFDVLLAVDLIEHLSKDEFMQLLKLTHHALAAAGHLILRYPNGDSPLVGLNLFNDITHVWTYSSNCMQTLAAMHGFSQVLFIDESHKAIRDHRWLKVPLSKLSATILNFLFRAAGKEKIRYWSPNMWACLVK